MAKKITIFLIDESDTGPRTIEVGGSSLKAIYSSRSKLKETLGRTEFDSPGIYVLKSDPEDANFSERVYIGEADPLRERLSGYLRDADKDFKECVAVMSTNPGELTKAHAKNMEYKLWRLAKDCRNAEVDNENTPTESTLGEGDEAIVDYFVNEIKRVFPLCGYSCFVPTTTADTSTGSSQGQALYSLNRKGVKAFMVASEDGYVVLKGSQACLETTASFSGYDELRQRLIKQSILLRRDSHYEFVENTIFTSPSAASSVILGTNSSGPLEWKDKNDRKLKDS